MQCTSCNRQATPERNIDARSPATVPSTLTAPSVPRGTISNVVTRYLIIEQSIKQTKRIALNKYFNTFKSKMSANHFICTQQIRIEITS